MNERAIWLALETMWTVEQIAWVIAKHPTMSDEELRICLEVAQGQHQAAMFATLDRAIGIYVKLEEVVSGPVSSSV